VAIVQGTFVPYRSSLFFSLCFPLHERFQPRLTLTASAVSAIRNVALKPARRFFRPTTPFKTGKFKEVNHLMHAVVARFSTEFSCILSLSLSLSPLPRSVTQQIPAIPAFWKGQLPPSISNRPHACRFRGGNEVSRAEWCFF